MAQMKRDNNDNRDNHNGKKRTFKLYSFDNDQERRKTKKQKHNPHDRHQGTRTRYKERMTSLLSANTLMLLETTDHKISTAKTHYKSKKIDVSELLSNDTPAKCLVCDKTFDPALQRKDLNAHVKRHVAELRPLEDANDSKYVIENRSLRKQIEAMETQLQATECVVCYEPERNILFMPCKHCVVCEACSTEIKECPICCTKIKSKILLFK
eukprot:231452_1